MSVRVLSVVFAFKHGISESNMDLKLECRSVHDLRHRAIFSKTIK